jgi:hypothetical protein
MLERRRSLETSPRALQGTAKENLGLGIRTLDFEILGQNFYHPAISQLEAWVREAICVRTEIGRYIWQCGNRPETPVALTTAWSEIWSWEIDFWALLVELFNPITENVTNQKFI